MHECDGAIGHWICRAGHRAGCEVFVSSAYLIGPDGPFLGEGPRDAAWNWAWRNATWILASGAGAAAALVTYVICAGPLGRTRLLGYRGTTRCGACGYDLAGAREAKCPECGRAV